VAPVPLVPHVEGVKNQLGFHAYVFAYDYSRIRKDRLLTSRSLYLRNII